MKQTTGMLGVVILAVAAAGCGMQNTRAAVPPPAGPVRAATAERDLIPAGTTLVIRTNEAIQAQEPGRTYSAQLAESIENESGRILAPRGAPAELFVVRTSGGTIGTPELELALRSITVNGRRYAVSSDTNARQAEEGIGRNQRTAEMVGGGALLGTLVGAIAGGGKGAVIGAITGAAGGGAVQVLTRGKEVRVPAETLLTFQTEAPLRLVG
jgi:hypothetical protein